MDDELGGGCVSLVALALLIWLCRQAWQFGVGLLALGQTKLMLFTLMIKQLEPVTIFAWSVLLGFIVLLIFIAWFFIRLIGDWRAETRSRRELKARSAAARKQMGRASKTYLKEVDTVLKKDN